MLKVNMMCPQNSRCSGVGIGILPLLPPSEPSSSANSSSPASYSRPSFQSTHSNIGRHLSARNQHFVGLLDDDLSSVYSSTPPPSSPSDHSPNTNVTALPMIATDDEGNLIFDFSAPGDLDDTFEQMHNRRHENSSDIETKHHDYAAISSLDMTKFAKKTQDQVTHAPFPMPPSKHSNNAALTPSFFTLPPMPTKSESSSPFPFAPPVPTTAGLGLPSLPSLSMSIKSSTHESENKVTPTQSNLGSPTSSAAPSHSTSNSNPTSPQSTPHASPTTKHVSMHTTRPTRTSGPNSQSQSHVPGPLSALHLQHLQKHPLSPLLSGVPSPSLAPPSPLSLYPPPLDSTTTINGVMCAAPANPGGFFSSQKRTPAGHAKRSSSGAPVIRPTSPIVKPLKS